MALWTDLIDPATLTGYAREALADYEARQGTLARWLPNREVRDINVRFRMGANGLVPVASFRAFDAEPEVGTRQQGKRVTLELPALGQNIPVSEYEQLRMRGSQDEDAMLREILSTTNTVVRAVADAIERLRGIVLNTGKATIDQGKTFQSDDDFGRPAGHTLTATSLWSSGSSVSRLAYLETLADLYREANGAEPGALVVSTKVLRSMAQGDEFQTQLVNGGARPATFQQVQDLITAAGLPPIFRYDRQIADSEGVTRKVLDQDRLLLLPAPVETNDWEGTQLGATFWGQTLTSSELDWGIAESDQPGIVTGVYRNEKPPVIAEVISDAIALPVLANASLSISAKVV
jgi:hypothetical protein